ncbi:MAG TPA: glycoside hydrolase family 2 TIM barrel-domain containing protein, partial [Pyrinomonadaceae bacterium]|nr:glycoside hydrolase family 2 TIM barrel-domain containing protein [Pyrinomonadaceae bacterium]
MKSLSKRFFFCFSVLLICHAFIGQTAAQETPRVRYTINSKWKFFPDNVADAEKREFQDNDWQKINLPHTWNVEDTFDDKPGYRRGAGWYRRELELNPNLKNKRIFLYFEGANHTADVFVNEKKVGSHIGGYTAFVFDITDFVEFDKPNVIAVRVDNTHDREKPPIDGDFTMYGGIYRDVWLIAAEPVHIKITDFASPGVRIETPQVSADSATVKISGTVVNSSETAKQIEVVNVIFDSGNRQIASINTLLKINAKSEANFEQISKQINNPRLWSPENPNLYKVKTEIRENGKVLDEVTNPLGFRWFKFDAEEGFFLNGKPLKLRGTNRHQDYKGLGNAVPDALQARDLEIIKENGFNFLRLAHYPQDPSVLAAADRLGLLLWEEIPIVNQIHVSPVFNENAKQMLREMIRQHRNHPSVIIWGYMNEVFLPVPKTEEVTKATVELAKELEKIVKTEDASRATAIAFDWGARELYHTSGLGSVTDIIGWNLYHGWYYETFEDFGKFIDDQHQRFPNRPLIISEYGANGDQRLHSLNPKRFDSTIEWQRMFHESFLPQINARPFIAGSAIWNHFDFGSEFRGETIPHLNQKGMYTYDREPKDVAFFYKANFSGDAVLHIASRDWQERSGISKQTIDVYSNLPNVELFHNGVSLGKKAVGEYKKASWEADLKSGKNSLVAQGLKDGILQTDSMEIYFTDYAKAFDNSFREIAVNVGSNADFIDEGKTVWTADQPYKTGGWGFVGVDAKAISTGRNVFNSLDDPLFQTMLENLTAYRFDVPDGDYEIELRFVEPKFQESKKRAFDVGINGQMIMGNFDLAEKSGFMNAFTRKFHISARNNRGISIEFTPKTEK